MFRHLLSSVVIALSLATFLAPARAVVLPKNLEYEDRIQLIRLIGLPASTKFLSNPFPIGGYPGIELGVSYQFIDLSDALDLGDGAPNQDESLALAEFTFAKGLYNGVDIFFQYAPMNHHEGVQTYGGGLRWGIYQDKYLPINVSLLVHGSDLQIGNSFVNQTMGTEILVGFNVENWALYFGGGRLEAEGKFIGSNSIASLGTDSILPTGSTELAENTGATHTFLGFSLHFLNLFFAAQLDRYEDTVFSAKIGMRL